MLGTLRPRDAKATGKRIVLADQTAARNDCVRSLCRAVRLLSSCGASTAQCIPFPRGLESSEHTHHLKHASLSVSDVPEGTEFFRHARVYIFLVVWLIGEDCFRRCFPPSDELLQKCLLRSSSGEYFGQRLIELFRSSPAAFGLG